MADYKSKFTGAEIDDRLNKMLNVTWQELKDLRDAGKLIAGQMYRMNDYETMTSQAGTQSAGHPFDLVLTALDNKTLSDECSAIQSTRDTDGYFANSDLSAWKVWYCLDNDTGKCNWAVTKGMVWEAEGITIHFEYYGPYTWNDTEYYAYRFNYGSMMEMGIVVWMYALYPTSTPLVGDTATYVLLDGTPMGYGIVDMTNDINAPISNIVTSNGKGVIYRMIDDKENDVHYDFKNIQFIRKITNGALDLENGVDTYCYTFSDFSTGTLLDASESLSTTRYNKFGLSCWNTVFLGKDSSAYCYHNTFGDDCYNNTFGDSCHSNTLGNSCFDNIFGDNCCDNTFSDHCNTNIFGNNCHDNTFGNCFNNILANDCYNNTFGDDCYDNTFGNNCRDNTFGNSCFYNIFGNNCYHNTFDNNCQNNTFGDDCRDNAFRNYCSHNTFGNICKYNIFDYSCYSNTFGNNCCDNIFANSCYENTFGDYCNQNVFRTYCFKNTFGNTCRVNTFGNGCCDNTFGTAESPLSNICKYNIDCVSKAEIAAVVDRDCITYVRKTSGGKIFTYTEDDIYNLFKPTS